MARVISDFYLTGVTILLCLYSRSLFFQFIRAKKLVEEENASDALNTSREERNRTLSEVAKKVLAVAARRGDDPSLVVSDFHLNGVIMFVMAVLTFLLLPIHQELSRIMQDGKIGSGTPYHKRRLQEADDSSPESQMSILTSEALSLCNIKLDDDTQTETPRPKESCPSPTPTPRSTPEVNGPIEPDTSKLVESRSDDMIFSPSKSVVKEEGDQPASTKVCSKEEESSDSSSTSEGSIASFNNVFDVKKNNKAADHGFNPTRLSNPEPYKGWDSLLTELRASGLILRDGDDVSPKEEEEGDVDDDSSCSYGSASFDSSYESEEE